MNWNVLSRVVQFHLIHDLVSQRAQSLGKELIEVYLNLKQILARPNHAESAQLLVGAI